MSSTTLPLERRAPDGPHSADGGAVTGSQPPGRRSCWPGQLAAILAPAIAPYPPNAVHVSVRLLPPSAQHLLGTDGLGRDVLSRLLFGARISLMTGVVVAGIGALVGTLIGGIAAYAQGIVEWALMRLTDLVLCFPPDHPGTRHRRRARGWHHQHHHRHAGGVVAEIRPPCTQSGAAAAGARIR